MRTKSKVAFVALWCAATSILLNDFAQSQTRGSASRCLSIADMDRRIECLESPGEVEPRPSAKIGTSEINCDRPRNSDDVSFCGQVLRKNQPSPSSADRAIDCRDPRDRAMCDQLQSGGGRIANPNYLGQPRRDPSFEYTQGAPPSFVQWCKENNKPPSEQAIAVCLKENWPSLRQLSNSEIEERFAQTLRSEHAVAEAKMKAQTVAAENLKSARERGYNPTSFDDFKLDGRDLATTQAKIMMQGVYKKLGEIETLQPSAMAVLAARSRGEDNGIGLITEDASRNVRKYLLQCGDDMRAPLGCQITVLAHVTMCTKTTLIGAKNLPCLAVEDGW